MRHRPRRFVIWCSGCRRVGSALGVGGLVVAGVIAVEGRALPSRPAPGQAAEPPGPERVVLEFVVAAHARNGPMDAARVAATRIVAPGARGRAAFEVATVDRPNLCSVGTAAVDRPSGGFVNWTVDAIVRRASVERIELEVSWQRLGAGSPAGDSRVVRLRSGESHLLDVVTADPGAPNRCSHVSFRVTATLAPLPADALLAYRIWLVVERDGRVLTSGPAEVLGPSGEAVYFRLRPVTWPLGDERPDVSTQPTIGIDVQGQITGTLTDTGGVEAMLHVSRKVHVGGWAGGSGTMPIRGRLGEAVTVGLPQPAGAVLFPAVPPGAIAVLPRGVGRVGPDLRVSLRDYFAGTETRLVIVTERVR